MRESTAPIPKRRTGRPATGRGKTIGVRMHPSQLELLDAWALQHGAIWGGNPSRPEAVRRLIAAALTQVPR
jgi:hypothetical protein